MLAKWEPVVSGKIQSSDQQLQNSMITGPYKMGRHRVLWVSSNLKVQVAEEDVWQVTSQLKHDGWEGIRWK